MVELFEGFAILQAEGLGQLLVVGHGVSLGGVLDLFTVLIFLALLIVGIVVEVDAQSIGQGAQIGLDVVLDVGDIGVVGGLVGPVHFFTIVAVRVLSGVGVGGSRGEALPGGLLAAGGSGGGTLDEGKNEGGDGELHLDDSLVVCMLKQTEL